MSGGSEELREEYERRINRVINYISAHCDEELSLEVLASVACFSPYHFHRVFRAMTGETLGSHIRRIRLEKAAHQLIFDRRKRVTAIALDCGFSSSQNFSRAFKQHFGLSPSRVRASFDFRDPDFFEKSNNGNIESKPGKDLTGRVIYAPGADTGKKRIQPDVKRSIKMNVEIKELEDLHLAYFRGIGPYSAQTIGPLFRKLFSWAGPRGYCTRDTQVIGVCWDSPELTPEEKCRYDACITVPADFAGEASLQTIPGGLYAVYHARVKDDRFDIPWSELMQDWLPASGYQPDDKPSVEFYYNNGNEDPEHTWIMDICLPVKAL